MEVKTTLRSKGRKGTEMIDSYGVNEWGTLKNWENLKKKIAGQNRRREMVKTTNSMDTNWKTWKGENKTWYFMELIKQCKEGIWRNGIRTIDSYGIWKQETYEKGKTQEE